MRPSPLAAAVAGALALAAALPLAGCASYQPIPQPRALNIAPDVWRVSSEAYGARGAGLTALKRAADLTLAEGGDWFRVLSRERGADGEGYGFSEGSGDVSDLLSDPGPYAVSTLEIEIGRGPAPSERDAYDAHAVAGRLGGGPPPPPARLGPRRPV